MRSRRTSRFQKMRWLSNERRDRRQRQTIAGRPQSGARRTALVLACPARSILRRNRFVFREVARPWRLRTSALDYRLGLEQVARLTEKFRCDPVTLIDMTQINTLWSGLQPHQPRQAPADLLPLCGSLRSRRRGRRHSKTLEQGVANYMPRLRPRLYRHNRASRQSCDAPRATPFEDLWSEAVAGEQIVERYIADGKPAEHSPIAVLRLLLVQTWKPITGDLEHPVVGWVLGTLFPNFDVRARPIKRRVTHMSIASLPIEFRPALLAGLARVSANPAVLQDLRRATLLRGQRNFDRFFREANFEPLPVHRLSHQ